MTTGVVLFRRGRVRGIFPVGGELPTLRSAWLFCIEFYTSLGSLGEFMAIPSAEVSVIFEREEEGEGVGNRDRFLAGCWWAYVIAD